MISRNKIAAPILLGMIMIIALACQSSGANPGGATPLAGTVGSGDTAGPTATVEPAEPSPVELSLKVTPVTGQPLTVRLIAELTGGPDNNRELYCQGQDWQFGDGIGMATSASCMVWTPSATIQRHFEQTYTYEKAGVYEVTFTYGPLDPITTTVEVR